MRKKLKTALFFLMLLGYVFVTAAFGHTYSLSY